MASLGDPGHVAVIGGGIVGASVGFHLARAGIETTLFDRRDEGRATDAGAGIVSPATSSRTDSSAWFRFAVRAAAYYPELVCALEEAGIDDHGYAACDLLRVAITDEEVASFETAGERTTRRHRTHGRPDPDAVEEVSPARARELFPPLADVRRARRYRSAARVDGAAFAKGLTEAGCQADLRVESSDVTGIRTTDGSVIGVTLDGGPRVRDVDTVVVAGGAWSAMFAEDLETGFDVTPLRGQIVHLAAPTDTDAWPIVSGFRHHYLVPWPDDRVAAGATREADVGFDPRTTAGGLHEVLSEALRVAPGLEDATHLETRVGLRPVTPDRLPLLGSVPGIEGAYLATGHGATGLQLGPYSGRQVARLVRGIDPETDLTAFDPARL